MHKILFIVMFALATAPVVAQNAKLEKLEAQGDSAMNRQDPAKAIKIYSKVIKSSKLKERGDYNALYKRAVAYYTVGDFNKALTDLDKVVEKFPKLPQSRMLRAIVHGELGHNELKEQDLGNALDGAADPNMLKWRASIYIDDEKYELAKKDLAIARLFDDDAETEMYLGLAQYNTGAIDSAFVSLDQAISLDATYLPAYMYASSFCLQEDRYEQALQYLEFAGRLDPKNMTVQFYKGIALVELDREDEGCRLLRKAFYSGMDDASGYLKEYCFGVEN